ncbi:hypothetical protein EVAR_43971_1 [Eumeta japonica]|uniref:Uncharacterized protein n=1 Tax=Eumeta variegata TaxID=151549 RepID=A0A4C1Y275_EUMVA|nr:hypothetical protein EVAR_43971_1 [Eumeta japonica]
MTVVGTVGGSFTRGVVFLSGASDVLSQKTIERKVLVIPNIDLAVHLSRAGRPAAVSARRSISQIDSDTFQSERADLILDIQSGRVVERPPSAEDRLS